jgi:hypothetical protein
MAQLHLVGGHAYVVLDATVGTDCTPDMFLSAHILCVAGL